MSDDYYASALSSVNSFSVPTSFSYPGQGPPADLANCTREIVEGWFSRFAPFDMIPPERFSHFSLGGALIPVSLLFLFKHISCPPRRSSSPSPGSSAPARLPPAFCADGCAASSRASPLMEVSLLAESPCPPSAAQDAWTGLPPPPPPPPPASRWVGYFCSLVLYPPFLLFLLCIRLHHPST